MKYGYLGPKNSFSFEALQAIIYDETAVCVSFASIPLCIQALKENMIDYAIVPIENSLEGSVHATVDSLFRLKDTYVAQEIVLPIRQQLMGTNAITNPQKILSHPQALAQSQTFLEKNYPNVTLEAVNSTTLAAEYVFQHPEESVLAIASKMAAEEYELTILAKDIQDNEFNQTRFWLLTNQNVYVERSSELTLKKTLFITLPANRPGALHQVLSAFAWRFIDLSKIESRPLKTGLGEYFFIIDLVIDNNQQLIDYAISEIEQLGGTIQSLGTYPILSVKNN